MFTEDTTAFFAVAELGDTVTVNGVAVLAMFDNGYSAGDVGTLGMASTQPAITLATADVPASPVGMAAVCNGGAYTIVAHEPDGTGISRLMLESA